MKHSFLYILLTFIFVSCIAEKSKIVVNLKAKKDITKEGINRAFINVVKIQNNQLIISGTNLLSIEAVKINGDSFNESFQIESKSANQIIANSLRSLNFDISKVFNLILSDASASATFPINFSLCQASINGVGFNCNIAPNPNDVLSYDQATNSWKPRPLNGLSYHGGWDATGALPSVASPGDYYIVTEGGAQYAVGDWIVWNGSQFDHIDNSSLVTTVFGRAGTVVATKGDYDLNKLFDVDLPSGSLAAGKVLKYDGSKWIAGDDLTGGGNGSISTSEIADGAITDVKITSVSASKITGTITSSQILDGTIANADIATAAGIAYSKLSIPNGSIPASKILNFPTCTTGNVLFSDGVNFSCVPDASGAGAFSGTGNMSVVTAAGGALATHATTTSTEIGYVHGVTSAIQTQLNAKIGGGGGTLSTGTINGVPTPVGPSDIVNKDYVDDKDALHLLKTGGTLSGSLNLDTDLKMKGASNYVTLKAHATTAAYNFVFPQTKGTSGYVLSTDGDGNTSWVSVTDSGVQAFAKTTLPACATGEVLKSNGTSFSCVTDTTGPAAFSGTASRAVVTGAGGALAVSTTTSAEIGYVNGVTSSIQTQINSKEATVASGTTGQYYRGDKSWQNLSDAVLGTALTSLSVASAAVVSAADTILVGIGKLQAQVTSLSSSKLSLTGGTLTAGTINGVPTPVGGSDVVNKNYVDSFGQWVKSGTDISYTAGSVVMKMDNRTCNSTRGGALRFNTISKLMEFCNESSWSPIGADLSPDAFSYVNLILQPANQVVLSENKVISGLSGTTPVAIAGAGAEFRINSSGSWLTSGSINPGNSIQMRLTTSSTPGDIVTADLTVGTYTAPTWTISTYNTLYTNSAVSQSTIYNAGVTGTVANLSDNTTTTGAGTNNSTSEFVSLDLGSAQDVQFMRLAGGNLAGWGSISSYLNNSSIQYSNNNSTWTTVATVTGITDPSGFSASHISFPLVNARYWRVWKAGYIATSELGVGK